MKRSTLFSLVLLALTSTGTPQADVIYHYEQVTPSDSGYSYSGQMILRDATYQSGALNDSLSAYNYCKDYGIGQTTCSDFPIQSIVFNAFDGFSNDFTVRWDALDANEIYEGDLFLSFPELNVDLTFNDDLAGSFYWPDYDGYSLNGLWELSRISTDEHPNLNCYYFEGMCNGASGKWVLDKSTVAAVPASGVYSVFLLAAALMFVRRRRTFGAGESRVTLR